MMKKKFSLSVLCATLLLFTYSCIEGFKDDETYGGSDVYNITLESPEAEGIKVTKNATKTQATISWDLVFGAGGYEYTVYSSTEDDNYSVLIPATDIDKLYFTMDLIEDRNYQVAIRTIGDTSRNNKDASEPTVINFSTFLPILEEIPVNTDLIKFFENYIKENGELTPEFEHTDGGVYDQYYFKLTPGGSYTMSGLLDFGVGNVRLAAEEDGRATITMTGQNAGFTNDGAGLECYYINFDCSATADKTPFFALNKEINEDLLIPKDAENVQRNYYLVKPAIIFNSCDFKSVNGSLIFDNYSSSLGNTGWILYALELTNCLIEMNVDENIINMAGGGLMNLTMHNSTIYNLTTTTSSSKRFWQNNNSPRAEQLPEPYNFAVNDYRNNTFVNIAPAAQINNSSGMNRANVTVNLYNNIFADCGGSNSISRFITWNGANNKKTFVSNCYWVGNAPQDQGTNNSDRTDTIVTDDPGISAANVTTGKFYPSAAMISQRLGDPRWWNQN